MTQKPNERENFPAAIEATAATAANDGSWITLTECFLRLPLDYVLAVQEAVRQGRWKNAKHPIAYLRTVAKREAVKMGVAEGKPDKRFIALAGNRGPDGKPISEADYLDYLVPPCHTRKGNGVWHAVDNRYGDHRSIKERLLEKMPKQLTAEEIFLMPRSDGIESWNMGYPDRVLDWEKIAAEAGLDPGELDVLRYRLKGINREDAMAQQSCEVERNKLQAAWRRFDRNGAAKLQSVLSRSKPCSFGGYDEEEDDYEYSKPHKS